MFIVDSENAQSQAFTRTLTIDPVNDIPEWLNQLDDVSKRKFHRSNRMNGSTMAPSMTSNDASTILAILVPAVKCEASTESYRTEFSRALVDPITHQAEFLMPLDTRVNLCL